MQARTFRRAGLAAVLAAGGMLLASCSLINDCFGSNTISRSRFNDLNSVEQLLYEQNSCGRYTRRTDFFSNLGNLFD